MPPALELQILQKAKVLQTTRHFFDRKNFIEVDTKILQDVVVPELHVHSLPCCDRYLLPSPELAMKNLLCLWQKQASSIYQLAHCFRHEDQEDALHSREFLMLEFYGLGYETMSLLTLVDELLQQLAGKLKLKSIEGKKPRIISFDELCRRALGLEFNRYWDDGLPGLQELYAKASRAKGRSGVPNLGLDDLFHLFLVEFLEPYIEQELPYCALYPYPDATPLPAKQLQDGWVDRWELYVNGIELANACREENRTKYLQRYRRRFERELPQTAAGSTNTANFAWDALTLWQQLPECSGAALGLDRLLAISSLVFENPKKDF